MSKKKLCVGLGAVPVSYTHLDVYKRQVRRWSGRTGQKRRKTWIRKNGEKILPVLLERERAERIIKIY